MSEPPAKDPGSREDVVALVGRTPRGHLRAVRKQGDQMALTELRPLQSGKPIQNSEVVALEEREGSPVLWDVNVVWSGRDAANRGGTAKAKAVGASVTGHAGPARVTTASYRTGWESIFGKKPETRELN